MGCPAPRLRTASLTWGPARACLRLARYGPRSLAAALTPSELLAALGGGFGCAGNVGRRAAGDEAVKHLVHDRRRNPPRGQAVAVPLLDDLIERHQKHVPYEVGLAHGLRVNVVAEGRVH